MRITCSFVVVVIFSLSLYTSFHVLWKLFSFYYYLLAYILCCTVFIFYFINFSLMITLTSAT